MIRLRNVNIREYEDQCDIVVDIELRLGSTGCARTLDERAADREQLAGLANALERAAGNFIAKDKA